MCSNDTYLIARPPPRDGLPPPEGALPPDGFVNLERGSNLSVDIYTTSLAKKLLANIPGSGLTLNVIYIYIYKITNDKIKINDFC